MLFYLSFIFAGALSGVIFAFAMDMKTPKELVQGAIGGIIAGIIMSLLLPH